MKKNVLKSAFKDINTDEIKDFLQSEKKIKIGLFGLEQPSYPSLVFYDEKKIKAGFYSFEINGLSFTKCWIEPWLKKDGSSLIQYRSGNYYVSTL